MNDNRNLILAMVLSLAVYLGWTYFVTGPQMKAEQAKKAHAAEQMKPGTAPASARRAAGEFDTGTPLARPGARARRRAHRDRDAVASTARCCSRARASTICA